MLFISAAKILPTPIAAPSIPRVARPTPTYFSDNNSIKNIPQLLVNIKQSKNLSQ
ncbi:hypothetical protein [Candidatus Lariskella endosymbiont of Hedychridium roseum]|uniref:hypothetical protein n=1 Tax=Candidatus Lariskella endosymbiont of Hedychridium roseum TaxID=3077949 RepID=UPI0030D32E13